MPRGASDGDERDEQRVGHAFGSRRGARSTRMLDAIALTSSASRVPRFPIRRGGRRARAGQPQREGGASPGLAGRGDLAPQEVRDSLADGETYPGALLLPRIEAGKLLKEEALLLGGDARAGVAHFRGDPRGVAPGA